MTTNATGNLIPHLEARSAADITRGSGSNFSLSFRFLDPDRRRAMSAVYAFFRIADDCVDELAVAEDKRKALAFWSAELDAAYRGQPQHPVMREFADAVQRYDIPQNYFTGLIEGCAMDIDKAQYETLDELLGYCYRVASLVGLTCMRIFGYESPTSRKAAEDLGLAFQLTNIIRDVGEDLRIGRVYLPRAEMRKFGYSEDELARGVENEAFFNLLTALADRAEAYYEPAFAEFAKDSEGRLKATRAMAVVYRAILAKIRRKHFPVLRGKVRLNGFEKARLILPLLWSR